MFLPGWLRLKLTGFREPISRCGSAHGRGWGGDGHGRLLTACPRLPRPCGRPGCYRHPSKGGEASEPQRVPLTRSRSAWSPDGRRHLTSPIAIFAATEENTQEARIWSHERHLQAKVPAVMRKRSSLKEGNGILQDTPQVSRGIKSAFYGANLKPPKGVLLNVPNRTYTWWALEHVIMGGGGRQSLSCCPWGTMNYVVWARKAAKCEFCLNKWNSGTSPTPLQL